jgi:hypothetical protein
MRALARVVGRSLVFADVTLPSDGMRLGIELEGDLLAGSPDIPEDDGSDLEPLVWAEGVVDGLTVRFGRALPEGASVMVVPVDVDEPPAPGPAEPTETPESSDVLLLESYAIESVDEELARGRAKGTVLGQSVMVDEDAELPPEGAELEVTVVALGVGELADAWLAELSGKERALLDEAGEASKTEEGIPAEVVLAELSDDEQHGRGVVQDGVVRLAAPLGVEQVYVFVPRARGS